MKLARLAAGSQRFSPSIAGLPALPPIDWTALGAQAPTSANTPSGSLPEADVVVITWADAEWAAMEHVFVASDQSMPYSSASSSFWSGWQKDDQGVIAQTSAGGDDWTYWGYYRLVHVGSRSVLLYKSNTHLDWPPGGTKLAELIDRLCNAVRPSLILSIGTAGGCRSGDHLGTVNVVNAATMYVKNEPPSQWQEYVSNFAPAWSIVSRSAFASLLFPIPATSANLTTLANEFNQYYSTAYPLTELNADGLVTPMSVPAVNDLTASHTPLLTASTFVVGTTSGQYANFAVIEMDDAVIAAQARSRQVTFGSVRNVSDPLQNAALPSDAQGNWGSAVYDVFGLYTSFNGALVTWALLAG